MEVTRKRDKEGYLSGVVRLEMSKEEAAALLEMINTNIRRQANKLDRIGIMGCWGCQEIALNVSKALSDADIIPRCIGSRRR